jgi:hypothetical protein
MVGTPAEIVTLDGVEKQFGAVRALAGVDLAIDRANASPVVHGSARQIDIDEHPSRHGGPDRGASP